MNFLTSLLAGIIDKFKVANPTLFMIVQFVLGLLVYAVGNCIEALPFCTADAFGEAAATIQAVLITIMGLLGSRTVPYLPSGKR